MADLIVKRAMARRDLLRRYAVTVDGQRLGQIRAGATMHFTIAEGMRRVGVSIDSYSAPDRVLLISDRAVAILHCAPASLTSPAKSSALSFKFTNHLPEDRAAYISLEVDRAEELARAFVQAAWSVAQFQIQERTPPGERSRYGLTAGEMSVLYHGCRTPDANIITTRGSANHRFWTELARIGWLSDLSIPERISDQTVAFRITDPGRIELLEAFGNVAIDKPKIAKRATADPAEGPRPMSARANQFGRNKSAIDERNPGHEAVLRLLDEKEQQGDEMYRLQVAGRSLFDTVYKMLAKPERGVRIEDMMGLLGATGGFACIVAALRIAKENGPLQETDIVIATGVDGRKYYFGDLPNRFLLESELSLFSLTLGAANGAGADVSWDFVKQVLRRTAATAGLPTFGTPDLSQEHRPTDTFENYVRYIWPRVSDVLDLYKVKPEGRASAIAFAIQTAIDRAKSVLDPAIAAQIVVEYAAPAAKRDPVEFEG